MQLTHYIESDWDDWWAAADLGRDLASKGNKLPLTDLLVATVTKRYQAWIYSTDPHFDLIPDLKRFRPGE